MKNFWIIAGEASGDMYGAELARELRKIAEAKGEKVNITGMGGPKMMAAKVPVKVDSTELGVMGIFEVTRILFTFIKIFFKLVKEARQERPDAVILIDYPGFNLLFALAMHRAKIPVIWYVCPHLWVWGKWRLPVLARICRKMLVIFPFEEEVFAPTPLKATFVGHPLSEIVAARLNPELQRDDNTFLLLPGSRKMEIDKLLVPMLESVTQLQKERPELIFHLAAPREKIAAMCKEKIDEFRKKYPDCPEISISCGDTGVWMQRAATGLAASGTVTVECALSGLPLVVGYKLNLMTLFLARILVKLYRGFFTMVNIIADKEVFQEFLQWHFAPKELLPAIKAILPGGSRRAEVEAGIKAVADALRNPNNTSVAERVANECWEVSPEK
ncbi:MAG: lipid-A-disaccharide synthase [Lentisphaerae bacterium]|nr:lipid-A-disaccharide synthase [Lentisphaerota bacterium]